MIEMTSGDIAAVTGGELVDGSTDDTLVTGPVEFDSRRITPGSLFMALPGARVDGHDFIAGRCRPGAGGSPGGPPGSAVPAGRGH